jgi:predicted ester cyclase/uncharacterized protein YndB with AHSA1/START domain
MKQTHADIVREFTRIFKNEHNVDGIDHLFGPGFRHNFRMPLAAGLAGFKEIGRMMNAAFPDVRVTEEALIVADDHVIERSSATATHRGTFMGIAGTGNPVRWTEIHIYRLRDAVIVEHWVELSTLDLIEQIRPAGLASVHEIGIHAPADVVFDLLSTQAGLSRWWTDAVIAAPTLGHVNRFAFGGGSVEMPFRVDGHEAPTSLAWTCIEGDRVPPEWVGTRIVATLMPQADGTTRLRFAHEGWRPDAKSFALCNTTWGELMHRLRDVAGGRQPGPHFRAEAPAFDGRQLVRELYTRLMGEGDDAAGRTLLADDYIDHDIPGVGPGGREELITAVMAVRAAFPDIQPVLHEMLADGDLVAVRVVARGRHTGSDFMGQPASGRAIEWNEVHVFRHAGGKLREHRGVFDLMGILGQLQAPAQ